MVLLALALGACGGAQPTAPADMRGGWILEIGERERAREPSACERALVPDEHASTIEVDLDGIGGEERVVLTPDRAIVIDAACATVRFEHALPGLSHPAVVGPTSEDDPWADVAPERLREWAATDRLDATLEAWAAVVRAGRRRFVVHIARGPRELRQRGYAALVVGCGAGACASYALGHVEWGAVPGTCAPRRIAANHDRVWLWAEPRGDGLVLRRVAARTEAERTSTGCDERVAEPITIDTARFDPP